MKLLIILLALVSSAQAQTITLSTDFELRLEGQSGSSANPAFNFHDGDRFNLSFDIDTSQRRRGGSLAQPFTIINFSISPFAGNSGADLEFFDFENTSTFIENTLIQFNNSQGIPSYISQTAIDGARFLLNLQLAFDPIISRVPLRNRFTSTFADFLSTPVEDLTFSIDRGFFEFSTSGINAPDFGLYHIEPTSPAPIPLPAAFWLMSGGLSILLAQSRKKKST